MNSSEQARRAILEQTVSGLSSIWQNVIAQGQPLNIPVINGHNAPTTIIPTVGAISVPTIQTSVGTLPNLSTLNTTNQNVTNQTIQSSTPQPDTTNGQLVSCSSSNAAVLTDPQTNIPITPVPLVAQQNSTINTSHTYSPFQPLHSP